MAGNADYSQLSWEELKQFFPDVYSQYAGMYGPGSPGYTAPATSAGVGTLGGGSQAGSGAYGGVPVVPDPLTTAGEVTAGNLQNLPGFQDLAAKTNAFNNAQALLPYTNADPNFLQNRGIESGNVSQQLQGQVPLDVWNQIQQHGAERGVTTGAPGGPNANAAMLAALGTNSIAMQNLGRQGQHQLYADTPVGPQFNLASLFTTTGDQQAAKQLASLYANLPNPQLQAAEQQRLLEQGIRDYMSRYGSGGGSPGQVNQLGGMPTIGATPLTARDFAGDSRSRGQTVLGSAYTQNMGSNYSTPLSYGPAGTQVGMSSYGGGRNMGNPATGIHDWSNPNLGNWTDSMSYFGPAGASGSLGTQQEFFSPGNLTSDTGFSPSPADWMENYLGFGDPSESDPFWFMDDEGWY